MGDEALKLYQPFVQALWQPTVAPPAPWGATEQRNERFNVYRNNVHSSLQSALAATFSITQQLVGTDYFAHMATLFLRSNPVRHKILSRIGPDFHRFVRSQPDWFESIPFLPDVMQLELVQLAVFHGADEPALTPEALQALMAQTPAPTARLGLLSTLHIVDSQYAVGSIVQAHLGAPQEIAEKLAAITMAAPETLVVWRDQWQVQLAVVPFEWLGILTAMRAGIDWRDFGESMDTSITAPIDASNAAVLPAGDQAERWIEVLGWLIAHRQLKLLPT